ncbi:MAG: hypothetical protein ACYSVY_18445 [Planctomycetota bacterium]|jgi:hypothetical protein
MPKEGHRTTVELLVETNSDGSKRGLRIRLVIATATIVGGGLIGLVWWLFGG